MAGLIYTSITSLDGFVADPEGNFDWADPDEEVHTFVNGQERPIATYLYGRRMYQTMRGWEGVPDEPGQLPVVREFAQLWRAADKVVYSTTLERVVTERTRLERTFDPSASRARLTLTGAR